MLLLRPFFYSLREFDLVFDLCGAPNICTRNSCTILLRFCHSKEWVGYPELSSLFNCTIATVNHFQCFVCTILASPRDVVLSVNACTSTESDIWLIVVVFVVVFYVVFCASDDVVLLFFSAAAILSCVSLIAIILSSLFLSMLPLYMFFVLCNAFCSSHFSLFVSLFFCSNSLWFVLFIVAAVDTFCLILLKYHTP